MADDPEYGFQKAERPLPKQMEDSQQAETFSGQSIADLEENRRDRMRGEDGLLPTPMRVTWEDWMAVEKYPDVEEIQLESREEWARRLAEGGGRGASFVAWKDDSPPEPEAGLGNTGPYGSFGRPRGK